MTGNLSPNVRDIRVLSPKSQDHRRLSQPRLVFKTCRQCVCGHSNLLDGRVNGWIHLIRRQGNESSCLSWACMVELIPIVSWWVNKPHLDTTYGQVNVGDSFRASTKPTNWRNISQGNRTTVSRIPDAGGLGSHLDVATDGLDDSRMYA